MGNLLGNWRLKEPSTVEECDSTWGSDSESEQLAAEEDNGISESVSPVENEWPAGNNGDSPSKLTDSPEFLPKMKRSFYAARDLYKYRHCYPNYKKSRQPSEYRNLRFYLNMIPLVPDGIYIEEILTRWRGDYDKLEHNHTYIQWLFPLREQGLNFYAHELTQDEIKEFQSTREAKRRFLAAYSLMLDFYGIKLLDKGGNVARSSNWDERFHHLNESSQPLDTSWHAAHQSRKGSLEVRRSLPWPRSFWYSTHTLESSGILGSSSKDQFNVRFKQPMTFKVQFSRKEDKRNFWLTRRTWDVSLSQSPIRSNHISTSPLFYSLAWFASQQSK
ncbi:opioid growth factor receptor-like protein 1 isoform X3 [Syngnathoides biaculeatus]|uniref:opioid growth factor receptor-like protein 1 isoform X3 n=1 Tax=Syngnathoides biaculeatus TaxID=300417 RepID=UPI002ADDD876|nr:opioid growth factor receptor-like protein 1 isoform X3 [Syngnathoides biaculeatus]